MEVGAIAVALLEQVAYLGPVERVFRSLPKQELRPKELEGTCDGHQGIERIDCANGLCQCTSGTRVRTLELELDRGSNLKATPLRPSQHCCFTINTSPTLLRLEHASISCAFLSTARQRLSKNPEYIRRLATLSCGRTCPCPCLPANSDVLGYSSNQANLARQTLIACMSSIITPSHRTHSTSNDFPKDHNAA